MMSIFINMNEWNTIVSFITLCSLYLCSSINRPSNNFYKIWIYNKQRRNECMPIECNMHVYDDVIDWFDHFDLFWTVYQQFTTLSFICFYVSCACEQNTMIDLNRIEPNGNGMERGSLKKIARAYIHCVFLSGTMISLHFRLFGRAVLRESEVRLWMSCLKNWYAAPEKNNYCWKCFSRTLSCRRSGA